MIKYSIEHQQKEMSIYGVFDHLWESTSGRTRLIGKNILSLFVAILSLFEVFLSLFFLTYFRKSLIKKQYAGN